MLKFTKRFAGSYFAESNGYTFNVETHAQYSGCDEGKGWVFSVSEDFHGHTTLFVNTKKQAIAEAVKVLSLLLEGELTID